jgi:uncharacterized protein YndB with AHSA1/START domain
MREVRTVGHRRAGVALIGLLLPALGVAASWVELPLPPRSQAHWVLQKGQLNGLPAQVLEIDSELSTAELLAFYREQFKRSGALSQATRPAQGWQGLSMLRDSVQVLVQVKAKPGDGGAQALLSQMDISQGPSYETPAELPGFPGAVLAQVTESHDGARRSRFYNYVADGSLDSLRQQIAVHGRRLGWQIVFDEVRTLAAGRQWLASYQGQRGLSVDVVVAPLAAGARNGRHSMTINLIDTAP